MPRVTVWDWIGKKRVNINSDGVLDKNSRFVFTNGQCHALALAVNQLTGWQIYALIDKRGNSEHNPGHVVVKVPSTGAYIDIEGPGATTRWRKRWGKITILPVSPEQARNGFWSYLKPNVNAALPFAKVLVEKVKKSESSPN